MKAIVAIAELDRLCRPQTVNGKRYARFHPVTAEDCALFAAALAGGVDQRLGRLRP